MPALATATGHRAPAPAPASGRAARGMGEGGLILAMVLMLGLMAAPATAAAIPAGAPAVVRALGLQDVTLGPPGLVGRSGDGMRITVSLGPEGEVLAIAAPAGDSFSPELAAPFVPAAVREAPDWPREGRIRRLELPPGRYELQAFDSQGQPYAAAFAADGTLLGLTRN